MNKDQGIIQIKRLEKVQHIESAQCYTHRPSVTLTSHWGTGRYTLVLLTSGITFAARLYIRMFHSKQGQNRKPSNNKKIDKKVYTCTVNEGWVEPLIFRYSVPGRFSFLGNQLQKWESHLKGYSFLLNCAPPRKHKISCKNTFKISLAKLIIKLKFPLYWFILSISLLPSFS